MAQWLGLKTANQNSHREPKPKIQQERKKSASGEEAIETTALLASTSTTVVMENVPYADDNGDGVTVADLAC